MCILFALFFPLLVSAQFGDTLYQKDIYYDSSQRIIQYNIISLDSVKTSDLKDRVLKWVGITFKNAEKVITSTTDNQIVIDYIESVNVKSMGTISTWSYQVRILTEFKDGRIRYQFLDQGNAYSNGVSSGTYYMSDYFKKTGFVKSKGMSHSVFYQAIVSWKTDIISTAKSLDDFVKKEPNKEEW